VNEFFFLCFLLLMEEEQKNLLDTFIIKVVKEMRVSRKISQEDIAFHLGVTPSYIGQIESPKYRAKYNLYHLNSLAVLFDCSPKDFLPEKPL